ncbi:hypothetical protein ASG67_17960 [Sphingomonas sp. Leaf339]|nr:hypothetical protein ASG67_17960 [Sphingomonas sp. Leaf339]
MPAGPVSVGQSVTIKLRNSIAGNPAATNLFSFSTTITSISNNFLRADFSNISLESGTYFIGMSGNGFNIGQDLFNDNSVSNKLILISGDTIPVRNGFVSAFNVYGDAVAGAVPEPATWLTMLVGFAMVAGAARYRRRSVKIAYA